MMQNDGLVARPRQFFIDGAWVDPSSDALIEVVSPATEASFMHVAEAQAADIERAVRAARKAFDEGPWPRMSHTERAGCMRAMADAVAARSGSLSELWTREIGIAQSWANPLIAPTAVTYRFYADLADTFPFVEQHRPSGGERFGALVREPVGVVGAIVPWNGALGLAANKIAPAMLAGCTIVLKSSPESPGSGLVMGEIAEEIGLPPGVLNVVTADREVSELLVRHPDVDKISFTGSSAAGRRIASICGERMARCTLELGGKSAAVVLADADIGMVAERLAFSSQMLTGQVCAALTRVVVDRARHDDMADALAAAFARIRVGDPFDAQTEMGPLAMRRQYEKVADYIAQGQRDGARLAAGGGRPQGLDRGFFVEPTVFAHVDNGMAIAREEIFGPVVSIISADGEEDAIAIANDSPFGLNASVFTDDADRGYRVARRIRSGTVGQNGFRMDMSIAFGGFKQSGIGREGGVEGLHPYLEAKTLLFEDAPTIL